MTAGQSNKVQVSKRNFRDNLSSLKLDEAAQAKKDVDPFLEWLMHEHANLDALKELTFTDPNGTDPDPADRIFKTLKSFESHLQGFQLNKRYERLEVPGFENYCRFICLQFSVIP